MNKFNHDTGLGDIILPFVASPTLDNWLVGLGPTFTLPTSTEDAFGRQQWAMGPTGILGYKTKKWVAGVFPQYFWGIGGRGDKHGKPNASYMNLLYFGFYNLPNAWQVGFNPAITYDNKASSGNKWNVPVGLTASKTVKIGRMPVKFQFGVEYSVVSQDDFGKRALFKLNIIPGDSGIDQEADLRGRLISELSHTELVRTPHTHVHEKSFKDRIRSSAREPLVHFLLAGAAIYGLYGLAAPDVVDEQANRITVTAGEVDWLAASWQKRWNRLPTPEERTGLIDEYVRETIFYREALAMGLDRNDTIIRRRLAQKLEFLSQDLIATVPPTEEELRAYFTEHGARYQLPSLTTFTHVFVDPDRRGERTLADAEAIRTALQEFGSPGEGAAQLGDPFMLQTYYPERSEREIAKLFGAEFARKLAQLEPGRWHGPVLSGYGPHLVYVESHSDTVPAEFAAVRERVRQDWEDARRRVFEEEYYANLRARYEVVIEGPGPDFAAVAEHTP